jgi:hypothetical protein
VNAATSRVCSLDGLLPDLYSDMRALGAIEVKGTRSTAEGEAVLLSAKKDGTTYSTYVATEEPHHIVKLHQSDESGGTLLAVTFSEFDQGASITPPPASKVAVLPGLAG